jgi:hypothetical protein
MTIPFPCPPKVLAADLERLERAFATYRREFPRLLREGHAGRFALIHDDRLLGIWDTQQAASQEGRHHFGLAPITVKKIDARDVERLALLDARAEAPGRR